MVYVLLLVQAAAVLLAAVGEVALMASPLYVVLPLVRAAALIVIGLKVVRGRRWALTVAIVVEWFALLGMWLGLVLGLTPTFAATLTLTGLLTEVALPAAVIVLCARGYRTLPAAARTKARTKARTRARTRATPETAPATVPFPVLVHR